MDEKKRSDTYQADCVTQKPTHRGRPVFTPGNAVIGDQGYDTKNRCSCCRGRAQHNVADHIPTATQPQIDLRGPAQYVGCRAITESAPRGTEGIAEGYERLSVNSLASESLGAKDQQGIPRAYTQQERHYQADGGIPGNESKPRDKNNLRPVQQQV